MRTLRTALFLSVFLLPGTTCLLPAQTDDSVAMSCRAFVQEFYDWYVPIALKQTSEPASNIALQRRADSFEPELLGLLREEAPAEKEAFDAEGPGYDPFLASEKPSERFVVKEVRHEGDRCYAEVRGIQAGAETEKVVAELVFKDGHWFFTNFHYPPSGDLLSGLQAAHERRSRQQK